MVTKAPTSGLAWRWLVAAMVLLMLAAMIIGAIGGGTYKVVTTFAKDRSVAFEAHPRIPLVAAIASAIAPSSTREQYLVLGPYPNSSGLFAQLTAAVNAECAPDNISDVHIYSYQQKKSLADYALVVLCKPGNRANEPVKFQYRCKIDPSPVDIQVIEQSKDDAIELLNYSGNHNGLYWIERQDLRRTLVTDVSTC